MTEIQQDPTKLAALAAALVKAQRAARAVGKDGENKFHGYKYASAESIVEEGRTALSAAGLSLLQTAVTVETRQGPPPPPASKGAEQSTTPQLVAVIRATYLLLHEEGGSLTWDREWYAVQERGRPLDKAEAGALTTGLGYALRDLLLLPRDDDQAQIDRRDDRDFGAALPPPPPPPPPSAPVAAVPPPPPPATGDWVSPPAVAAAEAAAAAPPPPPPPAGGPDALLAAMRQTLADSHSMEVVAMLADEAKRTLPPGHAEAFTAEARARWEVLAAAAPRAA